MVVAVIDVAVIGGGGVCGVVDIKEAAERENLEPEEEGKDARVKDVERGGRGCRTR